MAACSSPPSWLARPRQAGARARMLTAVRTGQDDNTGRIDGINQKRRPNADPDDQDNKRNHRDQLEAGHIHFEGPMFGIVDLVPLFFTKFAEKDILNDLVQNIGRRLCTLFAQIG